MRAVTVHWVVLGLWGGCTFNPPGSLATAAADAAASVDAQRRDGGPDAAVADAAVADAAVADAAIADAAVADASAPDAAPLAPCFVSPVYGHDPGTGHLYRVAQSSNRTWSEASDECAQDGATLTSIGDEMENTHVRSLLDEEAWIGLNDIDQEGTFVWASGEAAGYENWGNNQPNNSGNSDCVVMRTSGRWNDRRCGDERQFVCECSP